MATVARLILLLSILLMPLGMEPATASVIDHQTMMMSPATGHCPGQSHEQSRGHGLEICSMACASALPAQDFARDDQLRLNLQFVVPMPEQRLSGIHPEIATPPPKVS